MALVLITGAAGFIGSHLAPRLAEKYRIRCLVRPGSAHPVPAHPNIECASVDITDAEALRRACRGVDIFIHLAALLRTGDPAAVEAVNVGSTRVMVEEARLHPASRFIYLSSENALRTDLTDAYAESKRRAEALVRTLPHHLILQPCFVYGKGDHHGVGRLADLVESRCVVPLLGGLRATAQPVYVADLVQMILNALNRRVEGTHVVAGPDRITLNDIVRLICQTRGRRRILIPVPRAVLSAVAEAGSRWMPRLGWGRDQMNNIYHAKNYDASVAEAVFDVRLRGIREGFGEWFGDR